MVYTKIYKTLCDNYGECLEKIEQSYSCIDSDNALLSEVGRRAFKADMFDLFKILEEYSRYVLKYYKISVSDMTVGESLLRCVQLNKMDKELISKTKKYKALRDKYAHHYGKSSLRNFIEFYKNAKDDLYNQYKLMLNIYEKSVQEAGDKMDLFNKKS